MRLKSSIEAAITIGTGILLPLIALWPILAENGDTPDQLLFWILVITAVSGVAFLCTYSRSWNVVLVIILLAFIFHFCLIGRQPYDLCWNNDFPFINQIGQEMVSTKHWDPEVQFTGVSRLFKYHPSMYIFCVSLSKLSDISTFLVLKWTVGILNLSAIPLIGLLGKHLRFSQTERNWSMLLFALSPLYHSKNAYTSAESFALPLYLLAVYASLRSSNRSESRRSWILIAVGSILAVVLSHHLTAYVLTITLALLWLGQLIYANNKQSSLRALALVALLSTLAYQGIWAREVAASHISNLEFVVGRFNLIPRQVAYDPVYYSVYYSGSLSENVVRIRNMVLVLMTAVGLMIVFRHHRKGPDILVPVFLSMSLIAGVMMFGVDWRATLIEDLRTRMLDFVFIYISMFGSLGFCYLIFGSVGGRSRRNWMLTLVSIASISVILGPSLVVNAFPRYVYEGSYNPTLLDEWVVNTRTRQIAGEWTKVYLLTNRLFSSTRSLWPSLVGIGEVTYWLEIDKEFSPVGTARSHSYLFIENAWRLLPNRYGVSLSATNENIVSISFDRVYDNGGVYSYVPLVIGS